MTADVATLIVADAMVTVPKVHPATMTVRGCRLVFEDDHVHALILQEDGHVICVVERSDLTDQVDAKPARDVGRLHGRTTVAYAELEPLRQWMVRHSRRRLVVIDERRHLLGLLCLKRTGAGFCTDADVLARATDRRGEDRRTPNIRYEKAARSGQDLDAGATPSSNCRY